MTKSTLHPFSPKATANFPLKSFILMKIGYHVNETLEEIITRKQKEQSICGKIFWGYGGTLCHPITQVVPFMQKVIQKDIITPVFAMSFTPSRFNTTLRTSQEYSLDGKIWNTLPTGVMVTTSKQAIVCRNLQRVDQALNLSKYEVAVGPSKGKPLSKYLSYRTDKACAILSEKSNSNNKVLKINYIAEIIEPYAVCLR